jgi:nitrogen regulatory protein P-II 2
MNKYDKKLLVIFAEAALEKRLVQDARRFGAHGYTAWDVRGGSEHSQHAGNWDNDRFIEMKIVCSAEVADTLGEYLLRTYAQDYGLTLYFTDVQVLRNEKF